MNPDQQKRLDDLTAKKGLELYPQEDWDLLAKEAETLPIPLEYHARLEEVLNAVFEENPEVFDGVDWINSEEGLPLWVRPGSQWIPEHELDEYVDD